MHRLGPDEQEQAISLLGGDMQKTGDVAAYIMEAVTLAERHGGTEGESHITMTLREGGGLADSAGFSIRFDRGLDYSEYQVTIVRSR
jgi:hypothetical protein